MRINTHQMHSALISNLQMWCLTFLISSGTLLAIAQNHVIHAKSSEPTIKAADIVRDPADLPQAIGERAPALVRVTLTAKELVGVLDPASGTTYRYWTFNGKVPGPFIRVRQGDTVEITLANAKDSTMVHSIDFHFTCSQRTYTMQYPGARSSKYFLLGISEEFSGGMVPVANFARLPDGEDAVGRILKKCE